MAERLWLVERTDSDDEQNIVILVYATPDGRRDHRKEWALTAGEYETPVSVTVEESNLGDVTDPDTRERYRAEAERMADRYDPDETL
ncbi:MAG: hypothetical protein ABEH77_10385 [Halobacteriaceae archaeon]